MAAGLIPSVAANIGAGWGLCLLTLLATALWLRYRASVEKFTAQKDANNGTNLPAPKFPYFFPLLGSLPLAYLWNPKSLVLNPNNIFQGPNPVVHVKILHQDFYLLRGAENLKSLFRASWACTHVAFVKFALSYAFGTSAKALSLYDRDDSGANHAPHPDSTVEARNRIDFLVDQSNHRLLEGPGLNPLWNRYLDNITNQLRSLHDEDVGTEWESRRDFMDLMTNQVTLAILDALCGPGLLKTSPDFMHHFLEFDKNLQTYMQGMPWFLAPRAYLARRRVLKAVRDWQQYARDNYTSSAHYKGDAGHNDDPFWGSSYFRERHDMFLQMGQGEYDHAAIASSDFGFIWAMRNTITATCWTLYEIYRDPDLLSTVRSEISCCLAPSPSASGGSECSSPNLNFNLDALVRSCPTLSAVYAETLRLRTHFYLVRMGDRSPLSIPPYTIPPRKAVVALTTVAHFDQSAWNTERPLDEFWPGRFLKTDDEGKVAFSTKGLEGSWVPYGGGSRQCPGRHFAKRQILMTTAMMLNLFDVEVVEDKVAEHLDLWGFGSGVSRPIGRVGVRIRRRRDAV